MRRRARLALACTAAAAAGCEVPAPTAPAPEPGLVIFGVLNPAAGEQVVMLMETRAAAPAARQFAPEDPVASSGETPVTGARVVLTDAAGDSAVLVEDRVRRADRRGAGVYRLWGTAAAAGAAGAAAPASLPVAQGGAYRLRVAATVGGRAVAAEGTARVPSVASPPPAAARTVRVSRDSVVLADPGAAGASGYVYSLRAENGITPLGNPQYRRAFEPGLYRPSGAAWAFAYAREYFVPGPRYVLSVVAADTNFFAYYAAEGDPFADRSRRTTLRGASGLFGAVAPVAAVPVWLTS